MWPGRFLLKFTTIQEFNLFDYDQLLNKKWISWYMREYKKLIFKSLKHYNELKNV